MIPNCSGTIGGQCSPRHSPTLSIAARADLVPMFDFNATLQRLHLGPSFAYFRGGGWGAIDAKVTSYKLMMSSANTLAGVVIDGPTAEGQQPFMWSTKHSWGEFRRPLGQPDVFNFDWQTYTTTLPTVPVQGDGRSTAAGVAVLVTALLVIAGVAALAVVFHQRRAAATAYNPM